MSTRIRWYEQKIYRGDKVPAPERDRFDIEGFDTLVQKKDVD